MLLLGSHDLIALFGNLHVSFLNQLRRSRHSIRVDSYAGEQVGIAPAMYLSGRAAQLYAHTALHQVCHEISVGIPGGNVSIDVVSAIVQRHVAGICVKHCDHFRRSMRLRDIVGNKLKVEHTCRQIAFEGERTDAIYCLYVLECYRNVDMKWFFGRLHTNSPFTEDGCETASS
jgi:hypothetical protein